MLRDRIGALWSGVSDIGTIMRASIRAYILFFANGLLECANKDSMNSAVLRFKI